MWPFVACWALESLLEKAQGVDPEPRTWQDDGICGNAYVVGRSDGGIPMADLS